MQHEELTNVRVARTVQANGNSGQKMRIKMVHLLSTTFRSQEGTNDQKHRKNHFKGSQDQKTLHKNLVCKKQTSSAQEDFYQGIEMED